MDSNRILTTQYPRHGRTRRQLLRDGLFGFGFLASGSMLPGCSSSGSGDGSEAGGGGVVGVSNIANVGPLQAADPNGLRLPSGFSSRIVAQSSQRAVAASSYEWHPAPDGGATFETSDGGWIYVSNSEIGGGNGGVGALRFAPDGSLIDSYAILENTSRNCAGGPTPWATWLSCEEISRGQVYECDPFGHDAAVVRPALGTFNHEAAAVDPVTNSIYLTEDESDGRLYRFVPAGILGNGRPDLSAGTLEVAEVLGPLTGRVRWHTVPDPLANGESTRKQVAASTRFRGGEGICYFDDAMYFTTKGTNRVWVYRLRSETIEILYDEDDFASPQLRGVDNVTVSPGGDVLVAEDGDNLEIVALTPAGGILPLLRIEGHDQSEVTGLAFDPTGTRLYFSSQDGPSGDPADGVTFEVTGPFFL